MAYRPGLYLDLAKARAGVGNGGGRRTVADITGIREIGHCGGTWGRDTT